MPERSSSIEQVLLSISPRFFAPGTSSIWLMYDSWPRLRVRIQRQPVSRRRGRAATSTPSASSSDSATTIAASRPLGPAVLHRHRVLRVELAGAREAAAVLLLHVWAQAGAVSAAHLDDAEGL